MMKFMFMNLYFLVGLFGNIMAANAYPTVCNEAQINQGCKPLLASYTKDDAHGSWMSMNYTECGGAEVKDKVIPAEGFAACVQKSSIVTVGPAHTRTNYKTLPIENGFYVQCHGVMGSTGDCEVVVPYPPCSHYPCSG